METQDSQRQEKSQTYQMRPSVNSYTQYKLEKYRFITIVFYILGDFGNSMLYQTFQPIAEIVSEMYEVKSVKVTIIAGIFLLIVPFVSFYSNRVID